MLGGLGAQRLEREKVSWKQELPCERAGSVDGSPVGEATRWNLRAGQCPRLRREPCGLSSVHRSGWPGRGGEQGQGSRRLNHTVDVLSPSWRGCKPESMKHSPFLTQPGVCSGGRGGPHSPSRMSSPGGVSRTHPCLCPGPRLPVPPWLCPHGPLAHLSASALTCPDPCPVQVWRPPAYPWP